MIVFKTPQNHEMLMKKKIKNTAKAVTSRTFFKLVRFFFKEITP